MLGVLICLLRGDQQLHAPDSCNVASIVVVSVWSDLFGNMLVTRPLA